MKRVSCKRCFKNFMIREENQTYVCPYCKHNHTENDRQISTNIVDITDISSKEDEKENVHHNVNNTSDLNYEE